jgi:hypothetical protein
MAAFGQGRRERLGQDPLLVTNNKSHCLLPPRDSLFRN